MASWSGLTGTTVSAIDLVERQASIPASVSHVWKHVLDEGGGGCVEPPYLHSDTQTLVGFHYRNQVNTFNDCFDGYVYQTRAIADFASLTEQGAKLVTRARLGYREDEFAVREHPGMGSCVATVDAAESAGTEDWLIPHSDIGSTRIASNLWDVTSAAIQWFPSPDDNLGFVLTGYNEGFPFSNSACLSALSNIVVHVDFLAELPAAPTPVIGDGLADPDDRLRVIPPTRTLGVLEVGPRTQGVSDEVVDDRDVRVSPTRTSTPASQGLRGIGQGPRMFATPTPTAPIGGPR